MEVKLDVLPIALHNFLVVQSVWHPLDTPYVRAPSMCLLKLCQKALSVCAGLDNTYEQPCVFRWPLSARLAALFFHTWIPVGGHCWPRIGDLGGFGF